MGILYTNGGMLIFRSSPEAVLMNEIEDYLKKKNRMVWSLYWSLTAMVGMLIMLLPVNIVVNEEGSIATWFILYIAFAGIALITYGAMLKGKMNMADPIPVRRPPSTSPMGEVGGVNLPVEDQELLYSLKELEEWFRSSSTGAASFRNPDAFRKEIERWYRLGIIKEINIRNLRRRIRELEAELNRIRGDASSLPSSSSAAVENAATIRAADSACREGIRVDA